MNIPIQETVVEIEKVDKEEEDNTREPEPELTLESFKFRDSNVSFGSGDYSGRRGGGPQSLTHFFTSACLTLRHSRH